MKNLKQITLPFLALTLIFLLASCGDDEGPMTPDPQPTGNSKTYALASVADPNISGTATFREFDDASVTVDLDITGTPSGGMHPAHIHLNTAAEGGDIAVTLGTVDGDTGESTINFNTLDDNTPITYNDLLTFDGYINVHLSPTELGTIVAQGDIGENELTGETTSYDLNEVLASGVSGNAVFAERASGKTLLTLTLSGTNAGDSHPSHIHANNTVLGGEIIVGLSPVDGETGVSKTHIEKLVNDDDIAYDDFETLEAYINVHKSDSDLGTILAQGNIGASVGSDTAVVYNVTNNGSASYVFNGNGLTDAENPAITLKRGTLYQFVVNAPGHPFLIKTVQGTGTGDQYSAGVTNNGAVDGTVSFAVPGDAPAGLFYNCQFHAVMTNSITVED